MFKLTEKMSELLANAALEFSARPALAGVSYVAKCDPCSGTCMGNCTGCYGCKGK